jgi:hypothetical protein
MTIDRIKLRVDLLNKIVSALKEAEASNIKDPEKLIKRALDQRSKLKVAKSHLKKPQN